MILNSSIVNAAIFACKFFLKTALYQGFFRPFIIDKTLFLLYVLLVFKGLRYGFASKSMIQSKNLKLKLGLCGLALTSFLALNSRSVVHADTVSGSNAGAITWDSDQDDSQVVKEDSQQQIPAQSEHVQAPAVQPVQQKQSAVQSVPVQNKVEQPAQKQATVQSNVQNRQIQPKMAVANVSSTVSTPNRVERSIVRQSNTQTNTVNRLNANNQRSYANAKVANIDATSYSHDTNVDIDTNNLVSSDDWQINIHWINAQGRNIKGISSDKDYVISNMSSKEIINGKYEVPEGYQLFNPNGVYNWKDHVTKYSTLQWAFPKLMSSDDNDLQDGLYLNTQNGIPSQNEINTANQALARIMNTTMSKNSDFAGYINGTHNDSETHYHLTVANSNNNLTGQFSSGYISAGGPISEDGGTWNWGTSSNPASGINGNDVQTVLNFIGKYGDGGALCPSNYTQLDDWRFTDNSGNARQGATANTVNVILVQQKKVDPNSSDCKRQAQRIIHVAFPNGVKPKSYGAITDSDGNKLTLDSNNNLTQTVTFTRTKTVDGLTGTTLSQTSWQQHGAINAVTLPAIPGYTMVTNN